MATPFATKAPPASLPSWKRTASLPMRAAARSRTVSTTVTAALYSLINDRLLAEKSTIISTNLLAQELGQRYSPQIASRLQGNFKGLTFVGDDIRLKIR